MLRKPLELPPKRLASQPITVERLERALLLVAYIMERDGSVYVPIYERLEHELEIMKHTEATMDRARERLEANRRRLVELGLKAKSES
jgi:hypothetical protein